MINKTTRYLIILLYIAYVIAYFLHLINNKTYFKEYSVVNVHNYKSVNKY